MAKMALAVHGGAGTILKSQMTPELEREYRGGLEAALRAGWAILKKSDSALDAVEAAVVSLEDFPLFNAGRGSVFTHEGKQEMDAAIMDGRRLKAGAVAFVRNIRNPIRLARLVMERTEHVLLAGEGANQFAEQVGVAIEPDEYFFTEHRWLQFQDALAAGRVQLDHSANRDKSVTDSQEGGFTPASESAKAGGGKAPFPTVSNKLEDDNRALGTVGAVACDAKGHLAAATSTGGMTNKKYGRIGDTPLIGAGVYADDICAVSCTGHGEFFMLGVSAYDVVARRRYTGAALEDAARKTIDRLTAIGGEGGLIAVDSTGRLTLPFNSEGMYRGWIDNDCTPVTAIYR